MDRIDGLYDTLTAQFFRRRITTSTTPTRTTTTRLMMIIPTPKLATPQLAAMWVMAEGELHGPRKPTVR